VIVVRAPAEEVEITCGGQPMLEGKAGPSAEQEPADPAFAAGTQLGKRYEDAAGTIELLSTKGGTSSLALNGTILAIKSAKPLPASD
jgi:hypothetical protein